MVLTRKALSPTSEIGAAVSRSAAWCSARGRVLALLRLFADSDAEVGAKLQRAEVAEDSGRLCQLQNAEVIDYVGVPTLPAIIEAIDALEEIGRRQDIELVLMGGIRDGVDAVKALCLGRTRWRSAPRPSSRGGASRACSATSGSA